jgi:hypothetical protein
MGWLDCHLWEFTADNLNYSLRIPDDPDWNERIEGAATVELSKILGAGVRKFVYVYDMGDCWQHRIIVEKMKTAEHGAIYPQFLAGERRCPPEDFGGFPGYYEFLENISSKQNNKRKAALDWYGAPYNPDEIDQRKIVAALSQLTSGRPKK